MFTTRNLSYRSFQAFTLTEILIVVVIIGIMAGLAGPRITNNLRQARARNAIDNLRIIHSAQQIYNIRNNTYCTELTVPNCNAIAGINAINGARSLNIISSDAIACASNTGLCVVNSAGNDFCTTVTLANGLADNTNPCCSGTGCPSGFTACGAGCP